MVLSGEDSDIDMLECRIRLLEARAETKVLGILVQHQASPKLQFADTNIYTTATKMLENEFCCFPSPTCIPVSERNFSFDLRNPEEPVAELCHFPSSNLHARIPMPNYSLKFEEEPGLLAEVIYKSQRTPKHTSNYLNTLDQNSKAQKSSDLAEEITMIQNGNRKLNEKLTNAQTSLLELKERMTIAVRGQLSDLGTRVQELNTEKSRFQTENDSIKSKIQILDHEMCLGNQGTPVSVCINDDNTNNLQRAYNSLQIRQKQKNEIIDVLDRQITNYESEVQELKRKLKLTSQPRGETEFTLVSHAKLFRDCFRQGKQDFLDSEDLIPESRSQQRQLLDANGSKNIKSLDTTYQKAKAYLELHEASNSNL